MGVYIDRRGMRARFSKSKPRITFFVVILSNLLVVLAMLECLFKTTSTIYMVQFLLGFGFALYCAALFGSIPYLVNSRVLGTAFGIRTMAENIGLFVTPMAVGQILSRSKHDGT